MNQEQNKSKLNPNVAALWILSVPVTGLTTNVASTFFFSGSWAFTVVALPAAAMVAFLVSPTGLLSRKVYGGTRIVRWTAIILLAAYPLICWRIAESTRNDFWSAFTPIALFTLCITLLGWQTLRTVESAFSIGVGVVNILFGAGIILWAVQFPQDVPYMLRAAPIFFGLLMIIVSTGVWTSGTITGGVAAILLGLTTILASFAAHLMGFPILGIAIFLLGICMLLAGVSLTLIGTAAGTKIWQSAGTLLGLMGLLSGVGIIIGGIALKQLVDNLIGTAVIVAGLGIIQFGIVSLIYRKQISMEKGAYPPMIVLLSYIFGQVLEGIATIFIGFFAWQRFTFILGIFFILLGCVTMLDAINEFRISKKPREDKPLWRKTAWKFLTERDDSTK